MPERGAAQLVRSARGVPVIGKVLRGSDVGGLLRYLFGPGRANEHIDPHLVASWDEAPAALEPVVTAAGRHDVRPIARLLEQPLAAASRRLDRPVWHCALRVAPGDRRLSDAAWREVARDVVHATGLAPRGDDGGCRWVAVRHADDHVHLVVTLARQDGAPARPSNDFYRVGQACRTAEARLGLTRTAPRDRTAARRATRGEQEKATRQRRGEPVRVRLQREVRTAAATAGSPQQFVRRLEESGLLVRVRHSDRDPGTVTGYAVALPGDRAGDGRPVWFGGGRLASDLTWPKLAVRWPDAAPASESSRHRLSREERAALWCQARAAATSGAAELRRLAGSDPAAGADLAHATADVLSVAASVVEGRRGGPLTAAANAFDRAGRDLHGRPAPSTRAGAHLRATARRLAHAGRASRDDTTDVLALVTELIALSEAVAQLRDVQQRTAQAAAAREAAARLSAVGEGQPVHRPRTAVAVHRTTRTTSPTTGPRGRVRT
jgi:hypothetical protein